MAGAVLWLSFEDVGLTEQGETEFADASGGSSAGTVMTAHGGGVELVAGPRGRGDALAFPEKCEGPDCPRAMLEIPVDADLQPGDREFEFGASVWLAADQTTTGANVVQQGRFGADGGLWKLQIDGLEGRPSCVVQSEGDPVIARSRISVADSTWHRVTCRRDATGIEIDVDGTVDRTAGNVGSLTSESPVRIGSPGLDEGDDQFHGRVDDVVLTFATSG